jgi:hypothetical protein
MRSVTSSGSERPAYRATELGGTTAAVHRVTAIGAKQRSGGLRHAVEWWIGLVTELASGGRDPLFSQSNRGSDVQTA